MHLRIERCAALDEDHVRWQARHALEVESWSWRAVRAEAEQVFFWCCSGRSSLASSVSDARRLAAARLARTLWANPGSGDVDEAERTANRRLPSIKL